MPRQARIDAPGALHHIICRGIERKRIFRDNKDRDSFLSRLGGILQDTSTQCFAWALIPNHFHLLLKTGDMPITEVMRRLLTGYAVTFNRRHNRHGHLFQNRYKSILCQEESYLLELVRYIHLNPLRANLVTDYSKLHSYRYSGHSRVMGEIVSEWQATEPVLRHFGKNVSSARRKYAEFVEDGIASGQREDLTGGGLIRSIGGWKEFAARRSMNERMQSDERILGDGDFVENVLKKAEEALERKEQYRSSGLGFDRLLGLVAGLYNLNTAEIVSNGKQPLRVEARDLLSFWAVRELGISVTDVATRVGLTQPAVSRAVHRGERLARERNYSLGLLTERMKS
jgi:REP element-mobilizing transposase RayT